MTTGPRFFNPDGTEFVHRLFSPAKDVHALAVGLVVPFTLCPPDGQADDTPPSPLWDRINRLLPNNMLFDEGWPKTQGEYLAAGACFPPAGHALQPVSASLTVGPLHKQLAVFGDRQVLAAGRFSAPAPFTRMPLTAEQAYGGPGCDANPHGRGHAAGDDGIRQLPNVEYPGKLMASAADRPPPAGFGPINAALPARARHLGRQDTQWQKDRWPHLPLDTDPRFFQSAPPDQWREDFWMPGEPVIARNMHPRHPELHGRLPDCRARMFAHQIDAQHESHFHELKVHAETVWLFPEDCLGLVIYRGMLPIADAQARDVGAIMAALEPARQSPEPIHAYMQQCLQLLGAALAQPAAQTPGILDQETLAGLPLKDLIAKFDEQRQRLKQDLSHAGATDADIIDTLAQNPVTRHMAQVIQRHGGSLDDFFTEIEAMMQELSETDQNDRASAEPAAALPDVYLPPASAPYAPTAPLPGPPQAMQDYRLANQNRSQVQERLALGLGCADLDLEQANLAGMDLSGQDFSGAILTGANFSGARLQSANFTGAHLNNARFDGADLAYAQLQQASLSGASFCGARLEQAQLNGSDCSQANFSDARLGGLQLTGTNCHSAWMQNIVAPGLQAANAAFEHANLEGANLEGANLENASLAGAQLTRSRLTGASCTGIDLSMANCTEADLTGCDLTSSRAGLGSCFNHARLDNAQLAESNWMGASLTRSTLTSVSAQNADFSSCDLTAAVLTGADLRQCCFDHGNLSDANLSNANLMSASFMNTILSRARLEHSNLYGATFVDNLLDGVRLDDANIARTHLDVRLST